MRKVLSCSDNKIGISPIDGYRWRQAEPVQQKKSGPSSSSEWHTGHASKDSNDGFTRETRDYPTKYLRGQRLPDHHFQQSSSTPKRAH